MTPRAKTRGELIRERRRALGETQEQFAAACGIERTQLGKAEVGERSLTLAGSILVARRLGLTVDDITELIDDHAAAGADAAPNAAAPAVADVGGDDDDAADTGEPPLLARAG